MGQKPIATEPRDFRLTSESHVSKVIQTISYEPIAPNSASTAHSGNSALRKPSIISFALIDGRLRAIHPPSIGQGRGRTGLPADRDLAEGRELISNQNGRETFSKSGYFLELGESDA
ncbi:hypothetical protein [Bradyrhizobium ivorense]|uniref:hypothetical protein n=1 Tax=Bradyrhizobium ivorense TaxID=2511166 RepID=UPI0010BC46F5|nr:hypothetical protein [Bradyrhizobium ivorense]VIO78039.1 hypothetical protein CI41S_60760 [Bradyrhizobium ivorense]